MVYIHYFLLLFMCLTSGQSLPMLRRLFPHFGCLELRRPDHFDDGPEGASKLNLNECNLCFDHSFIIKTQFCSVLKRCLIHQSGAVIIDGELVV